jgi:hypothetical protein
LSEGISSIRFLSTLAAREVESRLMNRPAKRKIPALVMAVCICTATFVVVPQESSGHGFSGPSYRWYDYCWIGPLIPFIWLNQKCKERWHGRTVTVRLGDRPVRMKYVQYHESGAFRQGFPLEDLEYPVAGGRARFSRWHGFGLHGNGSVEHGYLISEVEFDTAGARLKLIGPVSLMADGVPCNGYLARDTAVTVGGTNFVFARYRMTVSWGSIPDNYCDPAMAQNRFPHLIYPIPDYMVEFHPDGSIKKAVLAADVRYGVRKNARTLKAGTVVRFAAGGALESADREAYDGAGRGITGE